MSSFVFYDIPTLGFDVHKHQDRKVSHETRTQVQKDEQVSNEKRKSEISDEKAGGIVEDSEKAAHPFRETLHGKGLGNTLKFLREQGILKQSNDDEWSGRRSDKTKSKLVGFVDGDDEEQNKYERKETHCCSSSLNHQKKTRPPNVYQEKDIIIQRKDEFGRDLTEKEAFRVFSHKFHGKEPGKKKQEKCRKQNEQELKLKQQMGSLYTPLLCVENMWKAQAELKAPYIVISGDVKPGQTSDPRSCFATREKDLSGDFSPLLGDDRKVRSTTLDTWLPEQVTFMASTGNEKANRYWEARLPPNSDRNGIDKFIRAKYVEKRWVSKDETQPTPRSAEMSGNFMSSRAMQRNFPKKTRSLSLEEGILSKHLGAAQVSPPPVAKSRGGSFDLKNSMFLSPPCKGPSMTTECLTSTRRTNGTKDLYNLIYVHDAKKDSSTVTPSTWATFD